MAYEEISPLPIEESRLPKLLQEARKYLHNISIKLAIAKGERVIADCSLPIINLPQFAFQKLHDLVSQENHFSIQMRWQRHTTDEVFVNTGAGPCTIIFVHDKTNNQIISAHYPTTAIEGLGEDRSNLPPSSKDFYSLLDEIKTLITNEATLEVYLFGNHLPIYTEDETAALAVKGQQAVASELLNRWTKKRFETTSALQNAGLELSNIHDLRPALGSITQVDHVIYIPKIGLCLMRGNVLKFKNIKSRIGQGTSR